MSRWDDRVVRYPEDRAGRYRTAGLWGSRTLATEFHDVARVYADRDAVVSPDGVRLTYRELDVRTDMLAAGLAEAGLRPGDPVLLQLTNRASSVVVWYAILKAGLVPVCTLPTHRAHEIGAISRRVGAVAHVVESDATGTDMVRFAIDQRRGHPTLRSTLVVGEFADAPDKSVIPVASLDAGDPVRAREVVQRIQAALDPDDVAVFQLSGGTTGTPKVIPRLHAEYWYNAVEYARVRGWTPDARVTLLTPIIHNAGIVCALHGPHSAGACVILGTPDVESSLVLMATERATDLLLGAGHFRAMYSPLFAAATERVTQVILSGARVPERLFEALEQRGIVAGQLFGMSEGMFLTTRAGSPRGARAHTVGIPLSELDEFRILEPGGETEVPLGEVGELCCRGPYTVPGYFDAAERNAEAFTSEGFYRTGDLVSLREFAGSWFISVEGRLKDVIDRGGEKISAEEVEDILLHHPDISAAAVVAMPDKRLGERSCAFIVTTGSRPTLTDIQRHFEASGVAKFKWPERIEYLNTIPRTSVGKIDKNALRERAAEFGYDRCHDR